MYNVDVWLMYVEVVTDRGELTLRPAEVTVLAASEASAGQTESTVEFSLDHTRVDALDHTKVVTLAGRRHCQSVDY